MKKLFILILFITIQTNAQVIMTFAGTGTGGHTGDGGLATAAELNAPRDIAIDPSGNLFISDVNNFVIRRITASNIISTVAGSGTSGYSGDGGAATAANISHNGIAVDALGNIYFSDYNFNVRKINTSGIISTIAGNGTAGYSGDAGAATAAQLYDPQGIAVDGSGNIYIADNHNNVIRRVNSSGIISTFAGTGTAGYSGDGAAATLAKLNSPWGLAVDGSGNLYIADKGNEVIRKINTSGVIATIAGNGTWGFSGDGAAATTAMLANPLIVKVDGAGNLYIVDEQNFRIRKVNSSGIITTVAGNGTSTYAGDGVAATATGFDYPDGVAFFGTNNLYLSVGNRNVIYKVGPVTSGTGNLLFNNGKVRIIPNPANDVLNVLAPDKITDIAIYNVFGKVIYNAPFDGDNVQVDISTLPGGIYFIRINQLEIREFIKK